MDQDKGKLERSEDPMPENASAAVQELQLAMAHIVSHPRLPDIVDELDNDTDKLSSANADPRTFLSDKGLQLPPEWTVQFFKKSPLGIQVCINDRCGQISIHLF
ncbi:hypothetical protein ACWGNM_15630 [Streptomyces sp. NPDC055796]